MRLDNHRKGFTIIEVVLVLAVAGLIFLMVFIALPALQRSQRDTQRKNDVGIIAAAVRQYMANNKGKGPPTSEVISVVDYDDDDERHNLWDGGSGWQISADNKALRRYITDLDPGGVTTGVSVDNLTEGEGRNIS